MTLKSLLWRQTVLIGGRWPTLFYTYIFFWATFSNAQGFFLVLDQGSIRGMLRGWHAAPGMQARVSCMQSKVLHYLSPALHMPFKHSMSKARNLRSRKTHLLFPLVVGIWVKPSCGRGFVLGDCTSSTRGTKVLEETQPRSITCKVRTLFTVLSLT